AERGGSEQRSRASARTFVHAASSGSKQAMSNYVLRRLLALVLVLLGISLIVFSMMALLPGDPATAILGPYATPARVLELKRDLGLQANLVERYTTWLFNVLRGDFGRSYSLERPVMDVLV